MRRSVLPVTTLVLIGLALAGCDPFGDRARVDDAANRGEERLAKLDGLSERQLVEALGPPRSFYTLDSGEKILRYERYSRFLDLNTRCVVTLTLRDGTVISTKHTAVTNGDYIACAQLLRAI